MTNSPWIIDTTTETFEQDVLERSTELPVVVDFWAAWCPPCRELTPLLESLAEEYAGKFLLAKVDIQAHPQLTAAFRVQGIPHVIALRNKQIVNQFRGVLPELALRDWLDRIVPSPADQLVKAGEVIEADDAAGAEAKYREALSLAPELPAAKIALARLLEVNRRFDEARQLITELEERGFLEPEAERIKARLAIDATAAATGGVAAARAAAEAAPDDLTLILPLADALAAAGQHAEAMDLCLDVIRQDKTGVGVQAKETMLNILSLLDNGSELISEYRRKLASTLY